MPKPQLMYNVDLAENREYLFAWDGSPASDIKVFSEGYQLLGTIPGDLLFRALADHHGLLVSPPALFLQFQVICDNWMVTREQTMEVLEEEVS